MKCESQDLIKEINGLIGAVDGDTLKHLRRFIQKYNTLHWKYNRLKEKVQGLLEDLERAKRVTCDDNKKVHLDYCIYLVKKWFADVVEGEE